MAVPENRRVEAHEKQPLTDHCANRASCLGEARTEEERVVRRVSWPFAFWLGSIGCAIRAAVSNGGQEPFRAESGEDYLLGLSPDRRRFDCDLLNKHWQAICIKKARIVSQTERRIGQPRKWMKLQIALPHLEKKKLEIDSFRRRLRGSS
jgi:hypothetical protein